MKDIHNDLTAEQWKFLATLDALDSAVHISILDHLAPLTAGQLIDLMKKTADSGLLSQDSTGIFSFGTPLPEAIAKKNRQDQFKEEPFHPGRYCPCKKD